MLAQNEQMFRDDMRRHIKAGAPPPMITNRGWQQENFGDARLGNVSVSETSTAMYTSASDIPIPARR